MARRKSTAKAGAHRTKREQEGAGANVVERQGLDLNRYVLDHVLPGAAELCEEGRQREIALQRDVQRGEDKPVIFVTEVRGMMEQTASGLSVEQRGWYKTVTPLPHGLKPIMGKTVGELHWCYRMALLQQRVTRDHDVARRMSGGNAISFVIVGGGIEAAS